MKKRSIAFTLALFMIAMAGSIFPSAVIAHPADEPLAVYCTKILVFEVENNKKIKNIEDAYVARELSRFKELEGIRASLNAKLDKANQEDAEGRERFFSEWKSEIKDPIILERLAGFEVQIADISKKYDIKEIDILKAYREGINDLMVGRKASFMTAKLAFKSNAKIIVDKAKADCEAKADVQMIFTTTTTGLKAIHEVFKSKIAALNTPQSAFQKISAKRDADFAAITMERQKEISAAFEAVSQAFASSTSAQ